MFVIKAKSFLLLGTRLFKPKIIDHWVLVTTQDFSVYYKLYGGYTYAKQHVK